MLKELIIKKDDVVYGEITGGNAATLATVASIPEGGFAVFTYDGQLVSRTGTVGTVANVDTRKPFTLYAMENGLLRSVSFIGKGRNTTMATTAAAAKVLTLDVDNFPTSRSEIKSTGVLIQDADRNVHDPKARNRAELPVDDDTIAVGAGEFEGSLATLIAAVDGVATAVGNGAGVITITLDAGRNLHFLATGYLQGVSLTVSTPIAYANTLSAVELAVLEREVQAHLGRTQDDLVASQSDMFTKASLVETGLTYYAYFFQYIPHYAEYVDGGRETWHTMCIASPDAVPGGSDGDGTWAALINAIANPAASLS